MTARMDASEKTQPHGRRAMKGTIPDISLRDRGQTKGAWEALLPTLEEEGGE
jgi:hypothetical protein